MGALLGFTVLFNVGFTVALTFLNGKFSSIYNWIIFLSYFFQGDFIL